MHVNKVKYLWYCGHQCDSLDALRIETHLLGHRSSQPVKCIVECIPKCIVKYIFKCILRCHHKQPLRGSKPVKGLLSNQDLGMRSKEPIKNTIKNYSKSSGDEFKIANQKCYPKLSGDEFKIANQKCCSKLSKLIWGWGQKSQSTANWNFLLWDSNGVCEIGDPVCEMIQFWFIKSQQNAESQMILTISHNDSK